MTKTRQNQRLLKAHLKSLKDLSHIELELRAIQDMIIKGQMHKVSQYLSKPGQKLVEATLNLGSSIDGYSPRGLSLEANKGGVGYNGINVLKSHRSNLNIGTNPQKNSGQNLGKSFNN